MYDDSHYRVMISDTVIRRPTGICLKTEIKDQLTSLTSNFLQEQKEGKTKIREMSGITSHELDLQLSYNRQYHFTIPSRTIFKFYGLFYSKTVPAKYPNLFSLDESNSERKVIRYRECWYFSMCQATVLEDWIPGTC